MAFGDRCRRCLARLSQLQEKPPTESFSAIGNDAANALKDDRRTQVGTRAQPWVDPRTVQDPRFAEVGNQWERPTYEVPQRRSGRGTPGRWVSPGEVVMVGGIHIATGMFYLGGQLSASNHGGTENCLIDPSAKVASSGSDVPGHSMPYWPSYSSIRVDTDIIYRSVSEREHQGQFSLRASVDVRVPAYANNACR